MSVLAYSPEVVFAGEAARISVRGAVLRARILPGGRAMERQVPRMLLQPGCNHSLFSTGCGLDPDQWEFSGTIQFAGAPGWPHEFVIEGLAREGGGGLPTFFPDWFAGGWVRFGSGSASRSVPIVRSSGVSGGVVTLTLTRDPAPFPADGDPVRFWPGCDGRRQTCQAYHATNNPAGKFNNYLNFGGHPFRPVANPSLVRVSSELSGGKK